MKTLYANPKIQEWIDAHGVLDEYVRMGCGTCQQLISVSISTSEIGDTVVLITCDTIDESHRMRLSEVVGIYGLSEQAAATQDALKLATRYGLDIRGSSCGQGWLRLNGPAVTLTPAKRIITR